MAEMLVVPEAGGSGGSWVHLGDDPPPAAAELSHPTVGCWGRFLPCLSRTRVARVSPSPPGTATLKPGASMVSADPVFHTSGMSFRKPERLSVSSLSGSGGKHAPPVRNSSSKESVTVLSSEDAISAKVPRVHTAGQSSGKARPAHCSNGSEMDPLQVPRQNEPTGGAAVEMRRKDAENASATASTAGATDRSHTSLPKSARSAGATTNTGGKKQPTVSAVAIRRAICSAASKRELVARSGAPAPHTSAENTNCADVGRPLFAASESGLAPGSDASQRSVAAASALAKVKRAASRASSSRSLMDSTTSPGGSERGSMRASEGADGSSRSSGNAAKKATARHNRNSMPEQLQRHQAGDGDDDGDAAPPAQSQSALAHGSASPAAASSAVDDRGQPLLAEQRDIGAATAEKTAGVDRWEDREDDLVLELTPRGSADGVAIVPASSEEERPWGPRRSDGADSLGHHAIAQLISGDDPRVATATAVVATATVAVPTVDEDEDSKMMVEMLRELMGTELTGVRAAPGVDPRVGQRVAAESPRAPPSAELPISSLLLGIGRDGLDLGPAHLPAHLPPHLPAHLPRPPASPPNPASPSPRSLPLSGGLLGTPSSRTASRHPPPAYDPFTRQQSTASVATAADGAAAGHAAGAGRAHNTGAREAQPDRAEGHTVPAKRGGSLPAHSPPVRQPAAAQPEKDSASAEAAAQGNAGGGSRLVRNSQDRSWHLERLGTPQGGGPAGPEGTSPRARRARRQSAIIPVDDMHLPGTIAQSSSLGRTVYPVASTAHPFGS